MNKKTYALVAIIILAFCIHAFLTKEFFDIHYGIGSSSKLCNVNQTFNCEAVTASKYSQFMGIPLSIFGLCLHLVLFILLMGALTKEEESEERATWSCSLIALSGFSVLASLVMGVISLTKLSVYCPLCLSLYVLSIIIFALTYCLFKSSKSGLSLKALKKNSTVLILILAIPVMSLLMNKIISKKYSPKNFQKKIDSYISKWEKSPAYSFDVEPVFKMNEGGKIKLAEFADYLCPHCKDASRSLKAFISGHPDVEFSFYPFPLDGACNPPIFEASKGRKGNGARCDLAKGVYCGVKQNKGIELHNAIFKRQREYTIISVNRDKLIEEMKKDLGEGLDSEKWSSCLESPETHAYIESNAKMGGDVKVMGTPSIYLNGKPLRNGQILPILQQAYQKAAQ